MKSHYDILGVEASADFVALKKAYYRSAMSCHPDRFGGDPLKAEEFKRVVMAFNVLSDPLTRARYDATVMAKAGRPAPALSYAEDDAILDTLADDILEEMIVGNTLPRNTSLQTLMLDLERTERFCLFREAKTLYYRGQVQSAAALFRRYLLWSPINLLARYYLGRCYAAQSRYGQAAREYAQVIKIGQRRSPPLYLARIRMELDLLRRERLGLWSRLRANWLSTGERPEPLPPDEQMRREVSRAIRRRLNEEARHRTALPPRTDQ